MKMVKERNIFEILSVLDRMDKPLTSQGITEELRDIGIPLTDRMVRHYLQLLDGKGFTVNLGKQGRRITDAGRDELMKSYVYGRSDLIKDQIIKLISDARFDVNRQRGEVLVNLSLIGEGEEQEVRRVLWEVCSSGLFPPFVKIVHSGERLCRREVPDGVFGLATMSSITIDEILLNNGIYVTTDWPIGLLEIRELKPVRVTCSIGTEGLSIDPAAMMICKRMGSVYDAVTKGRGEVLADYREIHHITRTRAIGLLRKAVDLFGGLIIVGRSGENILGRQTKQGYAGIIVFCGESLPAALEEKGIETNTRTVESAINFKELEPIAPVKGEVLLL